MKLCKDCKWFGGVAVATGRYVCNEPRNMFMHPVDGMEQAYDAANLRRAPECQATGCGMDAKWWEKKA